MPAAVRGWIKCPVAQSLSSPLCLLLWCWVYLGQRALQCTVQPAESAFIQMSEATDQACFSKASDVKIQRIKMQVIQMMREIIRLIPANHCVTSDVMKKENQPEKKSLFVGFWVWC